MIRNAVLSDAKNICRIYNHYILKSVISFEESKVTISEMKNRIRKTKKDLDWIVFEKDNKILGYAYSSKWKDRSAYRFTAEISVYTDENFRCKGIGGKLLKRILELCSEKKLHSLIGVIAQPNEASVKLFERSGFSKTGEFRESGFKFGRYINVGYWQKLI